MRKRAKRSQLLGQTLPPYTQALAINIHCFSCSEPHFLLCAHSRIASHQPCLLILCEKLRQSSSPFLLCHPPRSVNASNAQLRHAVTVVLFVIEKDHLLEWNSCESNSTDTLKMTRVFPVKCQEQNSHQTTKHRGLPGRKKLSSVAHRNNLK